MQNFNVTIIQSDIYWENITANLAAFEEKIWRIKSPTDLIVLPEMFNTGFTMNNVNFAESMNMTTFKWMKQLSNQTGAVITGSYIIKENQKYFNRLIWMQPNGEYLFYDKKHLYRNSGEHIYFIAGQEKKIATWKDWRFCPFICYDLRFPIWSRNLSKDSQPIYDCLIYVANWPSPRHIAWKTLLRSRAIENLSYCLGVNRIGTDDKGLEYIGGSAVIDYKGNTLVDAENESCIQSIFLNKDELYEYRQKFPFYLDADSDMIQ